MSELSGAAADHSPPGDREPRLRSQQQRFQELLRYVWKHSTFYRDYYSAYGIHENHLADLTISDLPFLTKQILMDGFDTAVTNPRLRKRELEGWLQEHRDPRRLFDREFIIIHSSGSSGTIALFVYDRIAWQTMNSTMASRLPLPENYPSQKTRVAFYLASHGHFAVVTTAVRLPSAEYDTRIFSLLDPAEQVVRELNALQPDRLVGYSSSVTQLAEWALQGQLRIHPRRIFVSSDPLTEGMECKIQQAWGAPVYNLYGASESIYLAVKEPGQEEMTVMDDLNVLEVLGEDHKPVPPGRYGRVVLTNLYNYALPIVRYELGDYAIQGTGRPEAPFTTIRTLQGRVNDVLPVVLQNGQQDTIHPLILSEFYVAGLEKVQFISERPDHVQIEYLAGQHLDDAVRQEFQRILDLKGAAGTTVSVQRVPHIAHDPQTGKLRLVKIEGTQRNQPLIPVVNRASQESTQGRRVGPTNAFIPFKKEEIEQSLPARFEQQLRRDPNRLAVQDKSYSLTYDELNRAANRVARTLLAQIEGGEEPIGLLLEHGAPMIVAILGVLKAGKIYVPLDSSYPPARIHYMLEDSQANLIVTDNKNFPLARELAQNGRHLLNIDEVDPNLSDQNPGLALSPDTLAYILYTSGSTGQPKGVIQTHRNVLAHLQSYTNIVRISAEDRLSLLHAGAFGSAKFDIFGALLNGATVVPWEVSTAGIAPIASWLRLEGISILHWLPSAFRQFVSTLTGAEMFAAVRLLVLGSEPVSRHDLELYQQYFPPTCLFVNRLGSTETGNVRFFFADQTTRLTSSWLPVGYAVEDMEVMLLDNAGKAVAVGDEGEIVVRSRYLAPGYWRRPDLTQAAFLPDPHGGSERLYRTGDVGRMLPDGCLMHLGRKDFQVKISGHRIEVAEIELALLDLPAVEEAVVVAREDTPGDTRLVAYVVSNQKPGPVISELRRFLQQKLPDYMVPSGFMLLDTLPLTPNGKVDRRALPAPGSGRPALEQPYVPPQTPVEEILAEIWAEVLGLDRVGIHDNFFELGGHSLIAIQIMSRLPKAVQVELPLRNLFQAPTVAGLASAIAHHKDKQGEDHDPILKLPTIVPAPNQRHAPFPLTDVQQAYWVGRSWSFELGNVATHSYLEIESVDLDLERLTLACQRLIDRHDMLRAVVLPDGQQQIRERVPPYQIEVLDLRGHEPQVVAYQLEAVRQRLSHQVFPSDQWPLFEICATRLDDQRQRLHFSFDALIFDASSRFILFTEWSQLYQDPDTPLAPLELSFRDYVVAEVDLRDSDLYRRSQEYWWRRLPTLPPAPELPLAKNPRSVRQPRFVRRSARLEPETWLRLKNRATRPGLTPSTILLTAFAEVLQVWSKSPQFTLNLTLFHRLPLHTQVNNIVGDFTSVTLLAVDNSAQPTFEARARRLQEQLWDDLDHRYVSGVQVLRELARRQGGVPGAAMPVVFTSVLPQGTQAGESRPMAWMGDVVYMISQTPQVWLDHVVFEEAGALVYNWDAVEELFPEELLDDMFEAYGRLLRRLADEGESWEESWPETARTLMPPRQIEQRVSVNATETRIPAGMLHTLFAEQVPQRPLQPAVVSPRRTLTYEELFRRSMQVGHWLRPLGARPNTLVAVVMEKGWEQVVAVLGVLQSGAAYLPIDAELPKERLWYLLEHGEVERVLTQSWLDKRLEWPERVRRLSVDTAELMAIDESPFEPVQGPEDLAYVIYTSGSTGLPKGVVIDHRGAVNTIVDINQRFGVGPADRVLALSSLSFDLSVYDIFGTLAAGGTIIIPGASAMRDPAHWAEVMVREQVTVWNSVPALMEMLIEYAAGRPEVLPRALRLVLLSGDWIPLTSPDQIKALVEGVQVISLGGATEASIWSILHPIETVKSTRKSIPYGKPMANQRFHVLNEAMEPCPVWVPGQLYIGGIGLAKGYWRDEEKTCASFIAHPSTGERLYCTGDLGRYLPDGNIEFLGREDFQVKIQGYRVELGEIEAVLTQHPGVRVAVVTTVGEPQGGKHLVAYVVPDPDQVPSSSASPISSSAQLLQDDGVQPIGGSLLDPLERLELKLNHPGIRQADGDRPVIKLVKPAVDASLLQAYATRRSHRTFLPQPIPLQQFSQFLSCLLQLELDGFPVAKSRYGSAGSLYPVQTYLYIKPGRVEGLAAGVYCYHPKDHGLVLLSADAHLERSLHAPMNRLLFDASAFSLFLIGQLDAITPLYGAHSRDFAMLEAGLMTQLLEMSAPTLHIGLCQIGRVDFEQVRHLFNLEKNHVFLHSLIGGRIEPGQIGVAALLQEAALLSSSGSPLSEKWGTESGLVGELRSYLKEKLPEYMVPSTFILLQALPLTPNGKVDRLALPAPNPLRHELGATFEAPRTTIEAELAAIWAEVLGIAPVGIHDNFFALGGHSLLVTRVISRVHDRLDVGLPLRVFFEAPTVAGLAECVETVRSALQDLRALPGATMDDREEGVL
jgi:amino acid adenylation domain-containing protein